MSIVQWPHAVSTQRGKCVCLCNILIFPTWIRVSITLMSAQYVITKILWKWNINVMDYEINKMSYLLLSVCIKGQNEKCIWKIFVKYTQIRQSNTNTNISSDGFSNTNTNTNTDICVFKYKYKYVFDPSPGLNMLLNISSSYFGGLFWSRQLRGLPWSSDGYFHESPTKI